MGARLQYCKVVDKQIFYNENGRIHPGLVNQIVLREEPGTAADFLVLRGWTEDHGTFTEQWRLEGAGGGLVYESVPRELYLATPEHVERLEDEVVDVVFQYSGDDYSIVFLLDDLEVARAKVAVGVEESEGADTA